MGVGRRQLTARGGWLAGGVKAWPPRRWGGGPAAPRLFILYGRGVAATLPPGVARRFSERIAADHGYLRVATGRPLLRGDPPRPSGLAARRSRPTFGGPGSGTARGRPACARSTRRPRRSDDIHAKLADTLGVETPPSGRGFERFNIAPTQEVLAVVDDRKGRRIEERRWRLMPHWPRTSTLASR
jgi:hypothetical protein